jgi:hypothetical protein
MILNKSNEGVIFFICTKSVRVEGLEPPSLAAPDPKSGVSTNFTTPAVSTKLTFLKSGAKIKQ